MYSSSAWGIEPQSSCPLRDKPGIYILINVLEIVAPQQCTVPEFFHKYVCFFDKMTPTVPNNSYRF